MSASRCSAVERKWLGVEPAYRRGQGKEPPRVEPLGEVVLAGVELQHVVGNRGQQLLHLPQVFGPADHLSRREVAEQKIAECEFAGQVVAHLRKQRLGVFGDEAGAELFGDRAEIGLGRLQQHGHQRIVLPDHAAEVDAGVAFFEGRGVVAVQHEAHVGNDAQQVVPVPII